VSGRAAPRAPGFGTRLCVLVGTLAIAAWAAWRASVDLDPPALWLDDLWVVALAQDASPASILATPASLPPGFALLVALALRLADDIELAAQSVAFAAGLLAIAAAAALARRLTGHALAALLAAAILAADPTFLALMARAKPYTMDALCVLLIAHAAVPLFERPAHRALWIYTGVVCAGAVLSTLSLLAAFGTSAMLVAAFARRGARDAHARAQVLAAFGAQLVVAGAVASLVLCAAGFEAVRGFWAGETLAASGLPAVPASLAGLASRWLDRLAHAGTAAGGSLPAWLARALFALLLTGGAAWLWRAGRRGPLLSALATIATALALSLAGLLPLGTPRVDTFLLPLAAVAAGAAAAWARPLVAPRSIALLVPLVAVLGLQLPTPRSARYRLQASRPVVEKLGEVLRGGDALWSNLLGTFALGVYGPWPVTLRPNARVGVPHPVPALPQGIDFAVLDPEADGLGALPPRRPRIFVFACHDLHAIGARTSRRLRAEGYRTVNAMDTTGCRLELLARARRPDTDAGATPSCGSVLPGLLPVPRRREAALRG